MHAIDRSVHAHRRLDLRSFFLVYPDLSWTLTYSAVREESKLDVGGTESSVMYHCLAFGLMVLLSASVVVWQCTRC